MNVSSVRDGIKARLQTISGLRAYDVIPDKVTPPCAIVGQLDFTFDIDNARGLDQASLDVYVIVQRLDARSGQNKLDDYLGSGSNSIKSAIEGDRTLGGTVNTLRVTSAEAGTYIEGEITFLSYRYRLTIWGYGEKMGYTVASDFEVCGKKKGETLTEKELVGINVEALIGAGHIVDSTAKPTPAKTEEGAN